MPTADWRMKAREFVNCNCAYGCPCQFNALPTHGDCRAVVALEVTEGHHGPTRLDGLKAVALLAWPGAIHEGKGEALIVVDERANPAQREALLRILSGQDTEPGATIYQVFSTTLEKVHDPLFRPIELVVDIEGRKARLAVPGLVEGRGEPIRNPVTGAAHRARIGITGGFEYSTAEIGRGWSNSAGPIELQLSDSHSHFAELHLSQSGIVH
jgi:hypothetical protein